MPMSHRLAVYVVLRRHDDVLFLLRDGTGYRDGELGLPAGKVEDGETVLEAGVREAEEEVGVTIAAPDLEVAHVMERVTPTGLWLDWFLLATAWVGRPENREPSKCALMEWCRPSDERVSDYVRLALTDVGRGRHFSTYRGA
jgi:8-oxo-dGTP diphosphatase